MVLVAALLLTALVAGVAWLASWAWGRSKPSVVPALVVVALVSIFVTLLLRARGIPIFLLFLPFLFRLRPRARRCAACNEPLPKDAAFCGGCGAPIER